MTATHTKPMSLVEEVRLARAAKLPPAETRRAIREAAGVSLRRLALELNITHGSIYYYERGGNPGPALAIRYRDLLERLAEEVGYQVAPMASSPDPKAAA